MGKSTQRFKGAVEKPGVTVRFHLSSLIFANLDASTIIRHVHSEDYTYIGGDNTTIGELTFVF